VFNSNNNASDPHMRMHSLGRRVYAFTGVSFGVIGLVWQDFGAVWQPIENLGAGEHRAVVASVYALAFLIAGIAAVVDRFARPGFAVLAALHALALLGWVPRVVNTPAVGTLNGIAEMLSLVIGGFVAYVTVESTRSTDHRMRRFGQIAFAACAFWFGLTHFVELNATASFVPKWLPPSGHFWAAATGGFYVLVSAAIVTRMYALLAARLCTVMMLSFAALIWLPMLVRDPSHFNFCGTTVTLAMAASAWIIADSIAPNENVIAPLADQQAA
jgi:hypothetical protein